MSRHSIFSSSKTTNMHIYFIEYQFVARYWSKTPLHHRSCFVLYSWIIYSIIYFIDLCCLRGRFPAPKHSCLSLIKWMSCDWTLIVMCFWSFRKKKPIAASFLCTFIFLRTFGNLVINQLKLLNLGKSFPCQFRGIYCWVFKKLKLQSRFKWLYFIKILCTTTSIGLANHWREYCLR